MFTQNCLGFTCLAWLGSLGLLPGAILNFNTFNFAAEWTELLIAHNAGNPFADRFIAGYPFENYAELGEAGVLSFVPISDRQQEQPGNRGILVTSLTTANRDCDLAGVPRYIGVGNRRSTPDPTQLALLRSRLAFGASDTTGLPQEFYARDAADVEIASTPTRLVSNVPAGLCGGTMVLAVAANPHALALLGFALILPGDHRR